VKNYFEGASKSLACFSVYLIIYRNVANDVLFGGTAGVIIFTIPSGIIKADTHCSRFYLRELDTDIIPNILLRLQAQLYRPDSGIYPGEEEC
jgi:hypothetical protein